MYSHRRNLTSSSYVALAYGALLASIGYGAGNGDHVDSLPVSLEIRFQDNSSTTLRSNAGLLRFASLGEAGPTTHDAVARVLVDISFAESGLPFYLNFDLTKLAPDVWRGDVPLLPRNQQLHFAARALSAFGEVAFSGETLATLTVDNQDLQIPLAPAQNGQTFQLPRMARIIYPAEMFAGQEEQFSFTLQGNAGAVIGVQITATGDPMTPAAELSPATSTVTLTNTVADFVTVYIPPDVTVDTQFNYQVTITDARAQSAVAITTNFSTHVKPRPPGGAILRGTRPRALLNPVILRLIANGSETPGTVEFVADVSDDSPPDKLAFQWAYTPSTGTPAAIFANGGQGNPGIFQGYTLNHQGAITLVVTDEHNGTTTLRYQLAPDQFADAISHLDLKSIVAGNAHTCVLTGQGRVHCWGDNRYGQLGYGNAVDVGDAPSRIPYTAGDVPLPVFDPVMQLVTGNNHTCVLLQSGLIYCWGDNRFGQLGYSRTDNLGDGEPVTSFGYVPLGDFATRIAAGGDHTCAILQGGALRCWGRNDFGQLGRGDTANIGDNEPVYSAGNVDLGAGVVVKDLALGGFHTCALLATGTVRCWGRNSEGQLGYGHFSHLGDNEPISNLPNVSLTGTVRKLVAGANHTCALTFAGTLRCWGNNISGELGQSYSGYIGVDTGLGNSFWGDNAKEFPSNLPSDINTGAQITDVAAGDFHTCALSSDGQLKCWGLGNNGQLGYGNFNSLLTPPATGVNLDGVTAYRISTGTFHTCALRSNGTARCWGAGDDGRLGRGSTATSATATGDADIQIFRPRYTVGGTVSGLAGSGLVLRNNGGDDLSMTTDGTFTFPTAITDLTAYAVTVRTQPTNPSQTCTVVNGSGNLAGVNVTNVAITCVTNKYAVGGRVTGLAGTGVVLQNNGRDDLAISGDGSFAFATSIASGGAFAVTVRIQPSQPTQTCTISGGSGTIGGDNVTSVVVNCATNRYMLGGTISGLTGTVTLQNNGDDDLAVSLNGTFAFATPALSGSTYQVTVKAQPTTPSQTCTVAGGAGTVGGNNVTSVTVTCTTNAFTVGGTVSGLATGDSITLRNNGGDALVRSANGSFTFATPVASGQPYAVTIVANPTSPISQMCTVTNGSTNMAGANVTNVAVSCVSNTFTIGGSVSSLGSGQSVVLQDNGGNNLTVSANGGFTFTTPLASGSTYVVTVLTNPANRTCTVASSSGTVGASNVTNVAVSCVLNTFNVGGSVSGLGSGQSVVLRNNGGNDLTVSANGAFVFTTQVASGSNYNVTVVTNPAGRTCIVSNGSGTVTTSSITNVAVTCTANACALPWGGSIANGQSVTAFQASSAGCSGACVSQTRTCSLGVLSGTFTNQSCSPPGAPTSCGGNCLLYACPGSNSFTVPAGVTNIQATLVGGGGAGGGGGTRSACTCSTSACQFSNGAGAGGGAGASITVHAAVTAGAALTVIVGGPGAPSATTNGLPGGGSVILGIASAGGGIGGGTFGGLGGPHGFATIVTGQIENLPSTDGAIGVVRSGRCDGSSGPFFISGGVGGHINSSFISGFGSGGNGGDADQNGGVPGTPGQPGAVQISW